MKAALCILTTLLATCLAGAFGGESNGAADHGYTYSLGNSGRHTDINAYGVGSAALSDFKTLKVIHGNSGPPTESYGSLDAGGLSGGYNTGVQSGGDYNSAVDGGHNSAFGVGYIDGYDASHSNRFSSANSASYDGGAHSSGIDGNSGVHNENIKIIRVIHEFVRSDHSQNHGRNYGSKGATTYKLIHDYGPNSGGFSGYTYLTTNGHSAGGQRTEEPSQIIKVIHEKPTFSRNSPNTGYSYSNFNKATAGSVDSFKFLKSPGAFASIGVSGNYNIPSTVYSSPQVQYLPPSQEYFPPATAGGYKYKQ